MAAATLEQEMGRRSVAEAMRPIKDWAVASSSSAAGPVTKQMVAEACHPDRETVTLQEPRPPRQKTVSTPRPEKGGSRTIAEQGPVQAMWSLSPVVRNENPSALHARVPKTEESGSDQSDGSEDKQGRRDERHHPVARPTSHQDGDEEGLRPEQEVAMGTEPSADLALAILNGLDLSSLIALRDLSTGVSTTVSIPWPPAGMELATLEWRQRASQAMSER